MRSNVAGILVGMMILSAPLSPALASARIENQSGQNLTMRFDITDLEEIKDESGRWAGVRIPGFLPAMDESLGLCVPATSYLVAIPIGSAVDCRVLDPTYYEIEDYDLSTPGIKPALLRELPRAVAEVTARGYIGSQRVASVRISPLVLDQATGRLRLYTGFGVSLDFGNVPDGATEAVGLGAGDAGSFEETYKAALINYEQGRKWRRRGPASLSAGDYFSSSPVWIKIKIESTGVYCLTGRDLEAIGAEIGAIAPQTLRLYTGGGLPLKESLAESNASWMRQVAIKVRDGGDGKFGSGDSLLFYGLGMSDWANFYDARLPIEAYTKSFYSDFNYYWLTWGGSFQEPPERMAKVNLPSCEGCFPYRPTSFFERVHAEQNNLNDFIIQAEDGWYWRPLRAGDAVTLFANTFSPDVSKPAHVKVRVANWRRSGECSGGFFYAILRVNGATVADSIWQPSEPENLTRDLDATTTLVNSSVQRIDISTPGTLPSLPQYAGKLVCDRLYLAWYELRYWSRFAARGNALFFLSPDTTATTRYEIGGFTVPSVYVFDVTDQFEARELRGAEVSGGPAFTVAIEDTTREGFLRRYAVVAQAALRKPREISRPAISDIRGRTPAEYCVITHQDLLEPATTISDFHNGEVVTTDEIYNEFGWGVPDATAMRDFLRWRFAQRGQLFRVLLFGDASWDVKNYKNAPFPNYVPAYERRYLPPTSNPYTTDDWFAYLVPAEGDSTAYWPTIPMARIPAASAAEGALIVSKILEYTTNPELGPWQNRVMIVADDDRIGTSCGSQDNNLHTQYAEALSNYYFPQVFDHVKVYLTEYPLESTGLKPAARAAFIKNLNEGVLITNYTGHGDQLRLAQEEVFNPASVGLVHTGRKQTFFIAASCNVSRFDEAASSSMAEDLMRKPDGGTIGSLASTHLCLPAPNQMINANFLGAIFGPEAKKYPVIPIGDAAMIAKAKTVAFSPYYYANDEMYALLGDPALRLTPPVLDVTVTAAEGDTLHRKGIYQFSCLVEDSSLQAARFDGAADITMREAFDTTGYVTCTGAFLDYDIPGNPVYRGKGSVVNSAVQFQAFVPADAREGRRGQVRCFVTDGETSGSGLLDDLVIRGENISGDNVGPEISLLGEGGSLESGDSVRVGDRLRLSLVDDSGVAIKAKSEFIPAVTIAVDDGGKQNITDSVYAAAGDFTRSEAWFVVPPLSIDLHKFTIAAFDNVNNLSTREYTLLVGSRGGEVNNLVYAYPNPANGSCYIVCEYERQVAVDIAIHTISGRKIWEQASLEARAYHQILWDGTDIEGDKVANGAYLVKVEARDPLDPGFKATKTIVVALIR